MDAVRAAIVAASASDLPVFLTGESGTGKDMAAQAIHSASAVGAGPFVTLVGSALPDDIFDREIWGDPDPGSARPYPAVPRYLLAAQGGSLYLDDLCRMSAALQGRLLHLLDTGRVLDGDGTVHPFRARLIAGSNSDIGACLRSGQLRRDLYDRLAVIVLDLPPLRARGSDAAEIAAAVFPDLTERLGPHRQYLPPATLARISALPWPGNVRQLLNVLRRMALVAPPGGLDLPKDVLADAGDGAQLAPSGPFADIERRAILDSIARNGGSVQRAADELELAASTIYRKLKGWQGG